MLDLLNDRPYLVNLMSLLSNINVVLVAPSHPGNIGAAARAIKTMGLVNLSLVTPKKFPHAMASQRSAGAEDILDAAAVCDSLDGAIEKSTLVLGTSVREREVKWPTLNPRTAAELVRAHLADDPQRRVSILFGREDRGLSNEEMDKCSAQISINANPDYSSLNLASAVQIVSYEMRMALLALEEQQVETLVENKSKSAAQARQRMATQAEKSGHLGHLDDVLSELKFAHNENSPLLMRKLTRLYNKADLSFEETQILRGVLSAIQARLNGSN